MASVGSQESSQSGVTSVDDLKVSIAKGINGMNAATALFRCEFALELA